MLLKEGHIPQGRLIGHGTSQWTPFWLYKWKIQEDGAKRCAYKKRGCNDDNMDINNEIVRIVHYLTTTEDEGCIIT